MDTSLEEVRVGHSFQHLYCRRKSQESHSQPPPSMTAEQLHTTLLGQIPLFPEIRAAGDAGTPIVVAQPQHRAAAVYLDLAKAVLAKLA